MTAVSNAILTAAQWNAHVRDNFLETAPAKATTSGSYFVATGTNSITERTPGSDLVATAQTTSSTSYTDLATVGPSVTVTTGTTVIIITSARVSNTSAANMGIMSVAVSGATSASANDTWALSATGGVTNANPSSATYNRVSYMFNGSLTAGTNTITAKYRTNAGTAQFADRRLVVVSF